MKNYSSDPEYDHYEEEMEGEGPKNSFHRKKMRYIGIAIFLTVLNLIVSPGYFWAIFPILGMALDLYLKYYSTNTSRSAHKKKRRAMRRSKRLESGRRHKPDHKESESEELELKQLEKQRSWDEEDLV